MDKIGKIFVIKHSLNKCSIFYINSKGERKMKLKYNFVVNTVADNMVAVPVGDGLENFN